tara:strand:+ start:580 stop:705 length:126 start_codon:yes stop_codon:yes gene_type:complete
MLDGKKYPYTKAGKKAAALAKKRKNYKYGGKVSDMPKAKPC